MKTYYNILIIFNIIKNKNKKMASLLGTIGSIGASLIGDLVK